MSAPYSTIALTNYNATPPADDGTVTDSNKTKWSHVKSKIGDPLKTQVAAIDAALVAAFGTQAALHDALAAVAGTNTITATASPTVTAYAAGMEFTFTPAVTNTGATTLNVDGVGAKNVFANGAACVGGELVAGVPVRVQYDGTQFNKLGHPSAATQAQQETGSATAAFVTSGRQQYHPSAAKAWIRATVSGGTPSNVASYNVTSITDSGVGELTVTYTTQFSSTNYAALLMAVSSASHSGVDTYTIVAQASMTLTHYEAAAVTDPSSWGAAAFGDQ